MATTLEQIVAAQQAGHTALAAQLTQAFMQQQLTAQPQTQAPVLPAYPTLRPTIPARPTRPTLDRTQRPPAETQVTVSAAEKPVRICYGHVRIGGEIIWIGKSVGAWVFHVRWCLGEINSFVAVELEDKALPTGTVITNYVGTTSQGVDSTLSTLIPGYTDNLVITVGGYNYGIAYSVIAIPYALMPASINFTAEIQGKKVYDPRITSTVYSTNPSLHQRDFLVQPIYGMEWAVDPTSVGTAADANDDLVGGDKRRESGMIIETPQDSRLWIEALAGAAAVFLVVEDGAVKLVPNRPAASAGTLDLSDEIVAGSWSYQPTNQRNNPTVVHVRYTDTSTTPWSEHTATAKAAGVDAGTTPYRVSRLTMPWIQSHEQAYREAVEVLNGGALPSFDCSWVGADKHYTLERGDRRTLSNIPGVTGTKEVRILRNELVKQSTGSYLFRITAREYVAGEYSEDVVSGPSATAPGLPDPFSPTAVTDVSVSEAPWIDLSGHYQTTLETTWTGVDHAHARGYRILITSSAGANVFEEDMILHRGNGVAHATTSPPVQTGVFYTVEVWTISTIGAVSAPDSDTITPVGDALPQPGPPTGVSATERVWLDDNDNAHSVIELAWTGISDQWARNYRVKIYTGTDVIADVTVPHLGAVSHDYTTGPVDVGNLYICIVTTVNVEGDFSANATDSITPSGDILPPDNVTNLTATEYWGRIDLEWDNVLEAGDLAYRIKRGTQTDTWATAAELDQTKFMNPSDFAEDTIVWSDHDVPRGDKTYFVKGVDKQGDESNTAAEVDITIQTSKGSYRNQNPRVPQYPSDQVQQIYGGVGTIFTWLTKLAASGGQYGNMDTATGAVGTETQLDLAGPGVLKFCGVGVKNASTTAGYLFGLIITIDGYTVIRTDDETVPASITDEAGIVAVGALMYESAGTKVVCMDEDYLPFNESLKIETYKSNANVALVAAYSYFETLDEVPLSRPQKIASADHVFDLMGVNYLGVTIFSFHTFFNTKNDYMGLDGLSPALSTNWQQLLNITGSSGMLRFFSTAVINASGGDLPIEFRLTVDGVAYTSAQFTVKDTEQAALNVAGNIVLDSAGLADIGDWTFDQMPFDSSLKIESRTPSGTMAQRAVWIYYLT